MKHELTKSELKTLAGWYKILYFNTDYEPTPEDIAVADKIFCQVYKNAECTECILKEVDPDIDAKQVRENLGLKEE